MQFVDLSLDCLRQVFDLIGPHDIGHLWLCGSTKMKWLLVEGHTVQKFDFTFDNRFPIRFPHLVRHLSSLEHLSIQFSSSHAIDMAIAPSTSYLPPNLRFLDWTQDSAISLFHAELEQYPGNFCNLQTLYLEQPQSDEGTSLDLRQLSALKVLKILGRSYRPSPSNEVLLPPDLVDLTICLDRAPPEWISALPTSLTRLDLEIFEFSPFFFLLPPKLLDFTLSLHFDERFSDSELVNWQTLPRSLTSLNSDIHVPVSPSMIAQLPATLCRLLVRPYRPVPLSKPELLAIWRKMPTTLKEMGFYFWPHTLSKSLALALPPSLCQEIPCFVKYDAVSVLPRGIESLHIKRSSFPETLTDLDYPPGLLSLQQVMQSAKEMTRLPPNLTFLEATGSPQALTKEMARFFPKKLRQLRFYAMNQTQSAESWIKLPRRLDALDLDASDFGDAEEEAKIEKKMAENLPPFLRYLRLAYLFVCHDFYTALPKTLCKLEMIVRNLPLTSYEAFSQFPALSSLLIATEHPPMSWIPFMTAMPKKLRFFSWMPAKTTIGLGQTDLRNCDLALLPPFLISIALPASPYVTNHPRSQNMTISLGHRTLTCDGQ